MHDRIREWYDAFAASLATHDSNSAARQHGRNSAAAFREAAAPLRLAQMQLVGPAIKPNYWLPLFRLKEQVKIMAVIS